MSTVLYGSLNADGEEVFVIDEDLESEFREISTQNNKSPAAYVLLLIAGLFVLILLDSATTRKSSQIESNTVLVEMSSFTLYRDGYDSLPYFEDDSNTLKYTFLDNYVAVIEPNQDMILYVPDYATDSDNYFRYSICKPAGDGDCVRGYMSNTEVSATNMACSPYDEYLITIKEYVPHSDDDDYLRAMSGTAVCLYVRRELRNLNDDDLGITMDAMYALWSTAEEVGQSKFGANFHNSTYFVEAHHFNAAWQDGDHIHEGLGFLPQHVKITNMFETSMQAVNASVSLPYWDYTIETAKGESLFDSYAFRTKTFGDLVEPVDPLWGWTYRNDSIKDARIHNGRWKHLLADYNIKYPELNSNFGYLRAPWNTNPSPYVSRFAAYTTTLPSCSNFYRMLEYSDLTDFLQNSPYSPHASTHGAIGSVYGCDAMDALREAGLLLDADAQIKLCQKWSFIVKELHRYDFLTPNSDCTVQSLTNGEFTCPYVCNSDRYDTLPIRLKSVIGSTYVGTLSYEKWEVWRDFICEGDASKIFVGDHVESASPADPSFWPIHPTLERLLHAKLLSGGFENSIWPTDAQEDYVCDKSQCYENGTLGYYDACCFGHYEDDQLLDFINGDKSSGTGPTNKEIMTWGDPTSLDYSMPYIYDSFSWDHCDEDFDSLFFPATISLQGGRPGETSVTTTNTAAAADVGIVNGGTGGGSKGTGGSDGVGGPGREG